MRGSYLHLITDNGNDIGNSNSSNVNTKAFSGMKRIGALINVDCHVIQRNVITNI